MPHLPDQTLIYHITDLKNLPDIIAAGGLRSDAAMGQADPEIIGYEHIKLRRLTQIQIDCCDGAYVGQFVPFYFCPRSPMLFTVNRGNTGRPQGCQRTIVHLVSTVAFGISQGRPWAISDGNAGAFHTTFSKDLTALDELDWNAIRSNQWQGRTHQKSAEFLLADFFPWAGFHEVACYNAELARRVQDMLPKTPQNPQVTVKPGWYY